MLHVLKQRHPGAVAGLLTTTNEAFDRVTMHAVRRELLEAQAEAAGLPIHVIPLPWPCSNEEYEKRMRAAVSGFVADGFTHVAFGDLFLEDVRRYREERLAGSGLEPLFPIWKTRKLDRTFAGRAFDQSLLNDLPEGTDPCGENGELHSFAWAGPMFNHAIAIRLSDVVDRDGFIFADLETHSS